MTKKVLSVIFSFFVSYLLFGQDFQYRSKYPDIPIVDVHSHPGNVSDAANLIKVSERIRQKYGINLACWICLSNVANPAEMKAAANNRMLFAVAGPEGKFADERPRPHNAYKGVGIDAYAEEVIQKVNNKGYVGLKIHFGSFFRIEKLGEIVICRIDDPRFAQFFSRLEEENVLITSIHIAEPNGPFDKRPTDRYLNRFTTNDPVYYWEQVRAFENVVAKYPNLTVIAAHAAFLYVQDAQIDYLRYLLSTYPNLHIDIAAICHHMHYPSNDNLRDFFIEYQDRILYGMDFGTVRDHEIEKITDGYAKFFAMLETNQIVNLGFYRNIPTKGLDLPREVLEKIYYKNALKLYHGLRETMGLD
jgi:predicted TIM-barrel fold metal-dependent hydrolase